MPRCYFIVNPTSGRGKGQEFGRRVETKIHATHLSADLEYTTAPGHARELAKAAAKHYDIIVVVGGDGTLQEALNGMYGSKAVLGILPVGSGNDFVRAVSIPTIGIGAGIGRIDGVETVAPLPNVRHAVIVIIRVDTVRLAVTIIVTKSFIHYAVTVVINIVAKLFYF